MEGEICLIVVLFLSCFLTYVLSATMSKKARIRVGGRAIKFREAGPGAMKEEEGNRPRGGASITRARMPQEHRCFFFVYFTLLLHPDSHSLLSSFICLK